jgi:hypothetical protein
MERIRNPDVVDCNTSAFMATYGNCMRGDLHSMYDGEIQTLITNLQFAYTTPPPMAMRATWNGVPGGRLPSRCVKKTISADTPGYAKGGQEKKQLSASAKQQSIDR